MESTRSLRQWSDGDLLGRLCPALPGQFQLADGLGLEPADMMARHGLGAEQAWQFAIALELGRRALQQGTAPRPQMRGGEDVYHYLAPRLLGLPVEVFQALYLDAKGGILFEQEISRGTLTSSLVHPREVLAPALSHRAAALIVAHNHPSGDPQPSAEDRSTTRRLQRASRLLGIELLDHVVLGHGCYRSFLEEGWL